MPDNISTDYTLLNQTSSVKERQWMPSSAASLTINAVGAPSDGNTITLTNTAGLAKTYEFDGNSSVTGGNIAVDISSNNSDTIYGLLKDAIEGGSGHGDTLICTLETSPSGPGSTIVRLVVTQAVAGATGNRSVSFTVTNLYDDDPPTTFEGGSSAPDEIGSAQFLLGTKSTINLRGQTTTSRYRVFLGEEKS